MTERTLVRASAGLATTRGLTLCLQAVHFAVAARVLPSRSFGGFVVATALLMIAGALAEFGLVNTTILALERRRGEERRVLGDAVAASWVMTGTAVVLATIVARFVLPTEGWLAFCMLVPSTVAAGLQQPFIAYRRHRLQFTRLAVADVVARTVPVMGLLPLLAVGHHWSAAVQLAVLGMGLLVGAVASLALLFAPGTGFAPGGGGVERARRMVLDALPLGTTSSMSFVHTRVDQVVLAGCGFRLQLAAYAVAYRLLDAVLALVVAAGGVAMPVLSRAPSRDRRSLAATNAALLGVVALVVGVVGFAVAPQVTGLLGGERYRSSAWFARLLCPALVVSVLNLGAATVAVVEGQASRLAWVAALAVGLNLALNLLLDPRYGPRGAAVATVASEAVGFALVAVLARRSLPGSLPLSTIALPAAGFLVGSFGARAVWHTVSPAAGSTLALLAVAATGAATLATVGRRPAVTETTAEDVTAGGAALPSDADADVPQVDVVILTWNDGDVLERAVGSALSSEGVDVHVIVVDNGSERPATVPTDDRVRLLRNGANRGVAPGRNQGVADGSSPLVCVLDSDAVLYPSALRALTWSIEVGPDVGLAAPVFTGQAPEASAGRAPTLWRKAARVLNLTSTYGPTRRSTSHSSWEVDFAIGACQLFRRSAFDEVGGMDEGIFYGPEDVDFCLRLREAGWRVVQVGAAGCDHPARRRFRRLLTQGGARHAVAVARHLWRHRAHHDNGEGRWRPSMSS